MIPTKSEFEGFKEWIDEQISAKQTPERWASSWATAPSRSPNGTPT
jgi:hypothetical protein